MHGYRRRQSMCGEFEKPQQDQSVQNAQPVQNSSSQNMMTEQAPSGSIASPQMQAPQNQPENQSQSQPQNQPQNRQPETIPLPLTSVRYLILDFLHKRAQPTYASTIASEFSQYGIKKERVLVELSKLVKSRSKPVKRQKSQFNGRYLYVITENGIAELKRWQESLKERYSPPESPPIDPYLWLLENLVEPMTLEDLVELRGDPEVTLRVYLSQLYKMGMIEKTKQPEVKQISQRDRNGNIITRNVTVYKTYYFLKNGPLKQKLAENSELSVLGRPVKTIKMEVPVPETTIKEPQFTEAEYKKYLEWRESIKNLEEFNQAVIRRANKAGIRPALAYMLVFKQLVKEGKIRIDDDQGKQ